MAHAGALPAEQLRAAAEGLPALIAAALRACALSSQPQKLAQAFARACAALPAGAVCAAPLALLPPHSGAWLGTEGAAACLKLLVQYARQKGAAGRAAVGIAEAVAAGVAHPLGGLVAAALAAAASSCEEPPAAAAAAACGDALAAAVECVRELLVGGGGGGSSGNGAAAGKAAVKGRSGSGSSNGGSSADDGLWPLQLAEVCLGQLQQSAASAAASGALGRSALDPGTIAEALLLAPTVRRRLSSAGASSRGDDGAGGEAGGATLAAVAAAAEMLAAGLAACGGCRGEPSVEAWERLAAAAEEELEGDGNEASLQALAVALHNAAAALSSGGDGGGAGGARAWASARLLGAAFQCSARRWAPLLAGGSGGGGAGAATEAAAAEDLGRRAKAALTGLLRCAGDDGPAAPAEQLAAAAAAAVARLLGLLGAPRVLRQQQLLQSVMRLHVKLALALERGAPPVAGAGRGAAKASKTAGGGVSCTEQVLAAAGDGDGGGAAAEAADALALAEARYLSQLEAAASDGVERAALRARTRRAAAAPAACAAPRGWSDGEWRAQAALVAALCGSGEAADAEALSAAAEELQAGAGDVAASKPAKSSSSAGRRQARPSPQQQQHEASGGGSGGAEKLEAAALCCCLAALQRAHAAAEEAAAAAAAQQSKELPPDYDDDEHQRPPQQQQAQEREQSSGQASSSGRTGAKGKGRAGGGGAAAARREGVWAAAAAAKWAAVHAELDAAADLWQRAAEATGGGAPCRLPAASAQAALQAWHVAGLQGWAALQARLAAAAGAAAGGLSQAERQQLAPAYEALTDGGWLCYLLAPSPAERSGPSELQAAAEAADAAADASGGDGWARLAAARAHLEAAQAALECGDLPAAACCGERALVLASSVLLARDADGSSSSSSSSDDSSRGDQGPSGQQQAAAPHPALPSSHAAPADALAHWQSLGLYLSALLLAGAAHEAAGCPDEALRLLREAGALASAAHCAGVAAAAHGLMARVWCRRGDAARAAAHLAAAEATTGALGADANADAAAAAVLAAAAACAAGDVASATGDSAAALEAYGRAVAGAETVTNEGDAPLCWTAGSVWADAHAGAAACEAQADEAAAAARLADAVAALPSERWPTASAALAVELWALRGAGALAAARPPAGDEEDGQRAIWLAGFGGAPAHSNLMEEFACAADGDADGGSSGGSGSSAARARASASGSAKARGARKAPSASSRSAKSNAAKDAAAGDVTAAAAGPSQLLRPLLRLLPACRHAPRPLKRLCALLARACELQGAVHACALFLQLSIGAAVTEQQLMLVAAKLQQERRRAARGGGGGGEDASAAPDWRALQDALSRDEVLEAAARAADGARDAPELLAAVDATARAWLTTTLARLPAGAAVVSIGEAPGGAGLRVCRLEAPGALPLIATLPAPAGGDSPTAASLAAELSAILDDSAASMAGSADLSTDKEKQGWWRARIALDERLAALLARAGRDWLGPWRCLLAAPASNAARACEVRAAAAGFVAEHFDFVFGALAGCAPRHPQPTPSAWISIARCRQVVAIVTAVATTPPLPPPTTNNHADEQTNTYKTLQTSAPGSSWRSSSRCCCSTRSRPAPRAPATARAAACCSSAR